MVYGIDEAGRGPILGPMVLAAVAVSDSDSAHLVEIGVKDSKAFGSSVKGRGIRQDLTHRICADPHIRVAFRVVSVDTIDSAVFGGNGGLNRLEREVADALLRQLGAEPTAEVIADGASLFAPMRATWPRLLATDKAESDYPVVAAASIVAKHYRDVAMDEIAQKYAAEFGELTGGGYINPGTRRFLEAYQAKYGTLPPEARRSWVLKDRTPQSDWVRPSLSL